MSFTVIITTFNRPELICRAIHSAYSQAENVIVVNDGSSISYDEDKIITQYPSIKYIKLHENSGARMARNIALDAAKTNFALILDDDDELRDNAIIQIKSALSKIQKINNYPVYNFSTSNAKMDLAFRIANVDDYFKNRLSGDFTPVINLRHHFKTRYPILSLKKVGAEHLLWLAVAASFGIPTWRDIITTQVHSDAPVRLTSPKTFVKYAEEFAVMQDMTLKMMREFGWDGQYSAIYKKRSLALLLYALAANNKQFTKKHLENISPLWGLIFSLTKIIPGRFFKHLLYWIKRYQLRKSHKK